MTTSTRINSSSVHTYILVCFIRNYYIGLLANNTTWCQNSGCICISSTRRTYGRIHAVSCIHPVIQTRTIILWTELFPKERREREKIQGEILQRPQRPSFQLESKSVSSVSTRSPVTTTTSLILHTELILPQENYNNYKAHPKQIVRRHLPAVAPMYPSILHGRIKLLGPYSSSRLPAILPGRNSILHSSQPPRAPYSDSQAQST